MPTRYRRSTRTDQLKTRIHAYMRTYTDQHGQPPTMAEIGAAVGRAQSTVAYQLGWMADAGMVQAVGERWGSRRYWPR